MPTKKMHYQEEIERDIKDTTGMIPILLLYKWFKERYSTSKHLLTLYSIVKGLNAKIVAEIGVGRSTYALMKAAYENKGTFTACDRYDYRFLFNKDMNEYMTYVHGQAKELYNNIDGLDFIFIDYLSSVKCSVEDCYKEIKRPIKHLKQNGMIGMHDALGVKYGIGKALKLIKKKYGNGIEILTLPYNYGLTLIRNKMKSKYGILKDIQMKK